MKKQTNMNNELYLKTAFCCMACDGDIADEEVQLIKDYITKSSLFENLEVEKLINEYINSINTIGISFLNAYLKELQNEELTKEEEIQILKIAIAMIEADNEILYSEIKFFKRILACFDISDEVIEKEFPDKEDFFLPDIAQQEYEFILDSSFANISLNLDVQELKIDEKDLKTEEKKEE